MTIIHNEKYLSSLTQEEIWNNLMRYSDFKKTILVDEDSNKRFIVYSEGAKYLIYSEMRNTFSVPFSSKYTRLNVDIYAELEIGKTINNITELNFRIIKRFNYAFGQVFQLLVFLFSLALAVLLISWGLFVQSLVAVILSVLLLYIRSNKKNLLKEYTKEYLDLFGKIK